MNTNLPREAKPIVTYRFVVANDLFDSTPEPSESQIRALFKENDEIFVKTSREGPAWAAMNVAEEFYDSGYDQDDDWPMSLLCMDPRGEVHLVSVEMEMRPEFNDAKPTKLLEANVDDKSLPLFPEPAEQVSENSPKIG